MTRNGLMDTLKRKRAATPYLVSSLLTPVRPLKPAKPFFSPSARGGRLLLSLALSGGIGWLAWKRRSLTRGGALGAVATGTGIVSLGGWSWGLALISFFVSSTLLSHFRESEKERVANDKFSKGSQRDLAQVAANGGLASLCAVAAGATRSATVRETLEAGFVGALATATADTWATELGVLSSAKPRLLTTGQPVEPGTSGGITPLGSLASALGACFLGCTFWCARGLRRSLAALPLLALVSGLAGSLCDSLLGATIQAMYFCPACQCETERQVHSCGTPTRLLRGLSWCNNDVVNFFATLTGSGTAIVLKRALRLPRTLTKQKPLSQK
jgi:uncharacterized protein (TIGR00297 family)